MSNKSTILIIRIVKIALLVISIVGIYYLWRDWLERKKAKEELPKLKDHFKEAVNEINKLLSNDQYFTYYSERRFVNKYAELRKQVVLGYEKLGLPEEIIDSVKTFVNFFDDLKETRKAYNEKFVKLESLKYAELFNSLESYPLSADQVEAIVRDEDNNLVIAGAGTGKTTTIAGKVAYLLTKGIAKPEELLVISFTKNAVQEMIERCNRFCKDIPDAHLLEVRTFNGFGYFVERHCSPNELHLAFGGDDKAAKGFLQQTFDRLFLENRNFQKKAINFISFFHRPERDEFDFETTNDFIQHEKSFKNITLDGKEVKSKEELQIANFFCLNGINYEYEKHYPLQPEDRSANNASYYPDFYLPDYEIWHEHYGINRDGDVPPRFSNKSGYATPRDYYHALITWKENIHAKYGTKLIKTYSFESNEGRLLSSLKKQLIDLGVVFKPSPPEDILVMVRKSLHYEDFFDLIYTFLGLMKSNGKTPGMIRPQGRDKRFDVFMDVFTPLFEVYETRLQQESEVDFNDMINRAAKHFSSGTFSKKYKYILIDEFQDMSLGRYELLKSVKKQNPSAKLYAVGDDWQSIFRFTGSDISIITEFEKHFGYTCQTSILKTYRFNEEILKISSEFIQKNPVQLRKTLLADRVADEASFVFIGSNSDTNSGPMPQPKQMQVHAILRGIATKHSKADVFLIGRYHHNIPEGFIDLKKQYKHLNIQYHTAHKVKGMTCDYAILLDLDSGLLGFPSEMADDPLLNHLLHEGDQFENAEERRVFYVAITRAKQKNYLLFDANNPSKFIIELQEALGVRTNGIIRCPECTGNMVKRKGVFSEFYGCVNYPHCEGKRPIQVSSEKQIPKTI